MDTNLANLKNCTQMFTDKIDFHRKILSFKSVFILSICVNLCANFRVPSKMWGRGRG